MTGKFTWFSIKIEQPFIWRKQVVEVKQSKQQESLVGRLAASHQINVLGLSGKVWRYFNFKGYPKLSLVEEERMARSVRLPGALGKSISTKETTTKLYIHRRTDLDTYGILRLFREIHPFGRLIIQEGPKFDHLVFSNYTKLLVGSYRCSRYRDLLNIFVWGFHSELRGMRC